MKCPNCGSTNCQAVIEPQPINQSKTGCFSSVLVVLGLTLLFQLIGFIIGLVLCIALNLMTLKISQAPPKVVNVCQDCGNKFYTVVKKRSQRELIETEGENVLFDFKNVYYRWGLFVTAWGDGFFVVTDKTVNWRAKHRSYKDIIKCEKISLSDISEIKRGKLLWDPTLKIRTKNNEKYFFMFGLKYRKESKKLYKFLEENITTD